ncbi:MAG: R-phenyllactate dehydratase beta subunit [Promethearchaeota archaeon]|nr:MAG: R-phenyllactate dehydratase beta subunit [Candidatus Lokiarchaeota archaeon]
MEEYYVKFYQYHFPDPTLLYSLDNRQKEFKKLIQNRKISGIIFIGEKFCKYEYFEFPTLKESFNEINIPTLLLEFSIEDNYNIESYKTRIHAFYELLRNKK